MNCRHCNNPLEHVFLDLGFAPPSNALLKAAHLNRAETYYPLRLFVCDACWLVQTEDYASATELFSADYVYFSSVSTSWLAHAKTYSAMITERLNLGRESFVVELASNDGYLLKNFVAAGIPCLGIEPTDSTAEAAEKLGIPVLRQFFGEKLGREIASSQGKADLIIGNNVYAHVPDINDFTNGIRQLLKPEGTVTLEFPHLLRLIENNQFDTVYHEHYSYLSLQTVIKVFERAGLWIYDVEEIPTHGGSLRIYGSPHGSQKHQSAAVANMLAHEIKFGLQNLSQYAAFQNKADDIKDDLLRFLLDAKQRRKRVLGYGAAAKGCTLLNYAGIKPDLLPMIFDGATSKQGRFLPGCHIPVVSPEVLAAQSPDFILILPWNIKNEIVDQLKPRVGNGTQFVIAVPSLQIL